MKDRTTRRAVALVLALVMLAAPGFGAPVIQHDPVRVAEKGSSLGVRATVRDTAARIESVALFYAASRGMTPFRVALSSSGAGTWYGSIPGHMVGPGAQMLYYIEAENADGETRETDWYTVKLVEKGVAPEAIPAASDVARESQRRRAAAAATPAPAPVVEKPSRNKYLIPGAIIVGGAVAVGGALAIADSGGGGGGGGGGGADVVTNANFGGNYSICFEPTAASNTVTVCDSGLVNVYVRNGNVDVIGLWAAEVFSTPLNGSVFSVTKTVAATTVFPESYLILSGEISGKRCSVSINGYSRDPDNPGNYNGQLDTTMR
ncbi:MAG: hypothetical protein PHO14_09310 [Kiritimatiellae bacterium]|nr:hypothetical protein [Kiritimatiellia bacterium]MDD4342413.1 hypothetical protein [Kiritimatiellia bacterium]MDY0149435.1 hypothetical protein [Kiritimatiellia bacterium]